MIYLVERENQFADQELVAYSEDKGTADDYCAKMNKKKWGHYHVVPVKRLYQPNGLVKELK